MATCKICSQLLTIDLDPEDFNEATSSAVGGLSSSVPDDLLLACGCHFHWQCLLDESSTLATSLACPSCNKSISTTPVGSRQPQVITRYHNEGGIQDRLNIGPLITEEAYLGANPEARPARAYLMMCAEGDIAGVIELLKAIEDDFDEGDMSPAALLRYQDPLDGMNSGLHLAVQKSQEEVMWLLLWLSSELPTSDFPDEVSRAARGMGGAGREIVRGPDIRSLRNAEGLTAGDIAGTMGITWAGVLEAR